MFQSTEYQVGPYLQWFWRTNDFSRVMQRRRLEHTKAAILLLLAIRLGMAVQIIAGLLLIYAGWWHGVIGCVPFGLAAVLAYPIVWAHLAVLPLWLGRVFISRPAEQRAILASRAMFANHPGIKIAVAGSYGKTTMKELLATVLAQGKTVAATPANKNVSSSHARFASRLTGNEDILIIEYGEGAPGDVARFAEITQPTHAVITGLAPAHLDHYKTLEAAGEDIFSLANYVPAEHFYVNAESPAAKTFLHEHIQLFDQHGALGWKVSKITVDLNGTQFTLAKGSRKMHLHSGLVGRHQVGFLAFVAALAAELGLTNEQIKAGMAETLPFEHRMQPYQLQGAWVIDDTYNGNLEGIRAGTVLLAELPAKRKIYVTPGLVDQGAEKERVHKEVGRLISEAQPDMVVLMRNSVTGYIEEGLKAGGYSGEVRIETQPLEFYTNLSHFVATGDVVVMQNDWTDNYA
jgi:UDP-N-acetylmuramyl pentapeptide synthase